MARKVSGGGAPHRCGGTSQSLATQQSSIWSMSENHSIHEPGEGDVMQPLGRRPDEPHLLLVTAGARGDQRPVLFRGLQAEVLQEGLGHLEVRYFQRVMVQP